VVSGNKAVYPQIAALAHVEGCVYLSILVSTEGSIRDPIYLGGPVLMRQSAIEAAQSWRFKPSAQDVQTVSSVCYFLRGDTPEKLLKDYQEAAEKHPDSRRLTALAHKLLLVGSADGAEKYFRKALTLSSKDSDAEFGLGDSLAAQGEFANAIAEYQRGLIIAPKNQPAKDHLSILEKCNRTDN